MEQATRIPGSIVDDDSYLDRRRGLGTRIVQSWRDMRGQTRELIDERPNEHRLVFFVLLSDIIFFLSWSLRTVVAPVAGFEDEVPLQLGALLVGALLLRTLSMYAFSLVLWGASRLWGGGGSWRDTRTGVFWAALVAAPFGLLMGLATIGLGWIAPMAPALGSEAAAAVVQVVGFLPFVWFVSLGLAEAQGFRSARTAFQVLLLLSIIAMLLATTMWMIGIF